METTNKIECPKCKSHNIIKTGSREGYPVNTKDEEAIARSLKAATPIYKCKDCEKCFVEEIK